MAEEIKEEMATDGFEKENEKPEEKAESKDLKDDNLKDDKKENHSENKKESKKEKKNKDLEKIEELKALNLKLEEEVKKWKNEYLKAYADSQNFQKRINEEAIKDRKYASQKVVGELIQPIDMLIQIVNMPAPSPEVANYVIGFQMIANQLKDILQNEGLASVKAEVGKEFDPKCMQAVETSNLEEYEDNIITKVMQPGYMYKDRVLRAAMVVVNKKKKENIEEGKEEK